ncbi:MAG: LEPR-XLL domain-containing protein [Anaerolineaceae bacterium]|jgi:hypothetical protein
MPGPLLTMSCVVTCVHGGQATPTVPNPRVLLSGTPIPVAAAPFMIAGCAFAVPPPAGPGPTPCVSALFNPATFTTRVKSMGQPLLCQTSIADQVIAIPPAPPVPLLPVSSAGQTRVIGT